MKSFPHYKQLDAMDCGPSCLRMIAKHYGHSFSLQSLREKSFLTRQGVSLLGISEAAESIGFRTQGVRISFEQLVNDIPYPCILHWNQNHFVVCYNIRKKRSLLNRNKPAEYMIYISDPANGLLTYTKEEFVKCWISTKSQNQDKGIALVLYTTPAFYDQEDEKAQSKANLRYFLKYLRPHRSQLIQLAVGMMLSSVLSLIFPFLSQTMVDVGIGNHDLSIITLILIAQLVLFITQLAMDFIRSWIVLHTTNRLSISLISDFLIKLMKLPLGFFDTKMVGDIMQRIGDHGRIQSFLTGTSLSVVFSFANFIVFSFILIYFNPLIFGIFVIGNTCYVIWILSFMRYRRELDYKRFTQSSADQSNMVELITGMQEIKLCNCEKQKRWKWERIQVKRYKIGIRGLALGQYQQTGSVFFNQTTSLTISYIAARSVVEGNMTLGMMMSLSYIIGQLSGPIGQFIGFAQSLQDAKISLERLGEVHNREDEEDLSDIKLPYIPENKTIQIKDVWFSYDGADRDYALEDVSLEIPQNKTTAIVGASGSGKTTLVKLLLGFYPPNKGAIYVDQTPLKNINTHVWRQKTGAVMQEGFIFSDTIAGNIAVGDDEVDKERLLQAVKTANIHEYVDSLPLGYNTKIGMEGKGVSQGQKQRLLIARTVYKNPDYLFFDEATNSLDATNERQIMDNLVAFNRNRTVVIVAHRLSTVQHADNIVVLDKGHVLEQGTHKELVKKRGAYYQLVKNQLELGQ
ncbi:MAG: transporter ATP-binding protein [Bacteroidetes bacterium]|nr:transporter ATP-binding protein [Bacteroidota bacterium]